MEEQTDIIGKLIKRAKPVVPDHFFETFGQHLDTQLNDLDDDLNPPRRTHRLDVPHGFFDNFHSHLKAEIDAENAFRDLGIIKRKKPAVPANFETAFNAELQKQIKPKTSRGRILKITFWSTAAAVAAGLTLLLTLNTGETTPETAVVTTQPAALPDDASLDEYVAYLDEESVVDYIIEQDINVGENETTEEVYDYVDSDLEEIYMDL